MAVADFTHGQARIGEAVWDRSGPVPVLWQDSPGPLIAAVGFRVGRADEGLARSGLTHLVEHLAVHGLGDRLYDYDGFVNGTTTWFGFRGAPEELPELIDHIGRTLGDLPLGHLDAELGVMRAEESRRAVSIAGRSLLLRFGTRGWGTFDLPQYGLYAVTPEEVAGWAARWFCAGNAVVWMTGAPPPGLSIDLPGGGPRAEPPPVPLPWRQLPAWTTHPRPVTAMSMLLPRGVEAVTAAAILQARLRHVVRDVDGSSYDVSLAVDDLDRRTTHVLISVDGPSAPVVEALAAVSESLAADGATADELSHQRSLHRRRAADPTVVPGRLAAEAEAALCGRSWASPSEEVARLDEATPATIAGVIVDGLASALYLVPVGTPFPASLGSPLGDVPAMPVAGRALRAAGARRDDRRRLVVGAEGLSEMDGHRATTVRTSDATAVLMWSEGARLLIGADGMALPVDPARWAGAARALGTFDESVPGHLVVPMGDRPPWAAVDGRRRRRRRGEGSAQA